MKTQRQSVRWTINQAAADFGIDDATLSKNLRQCDEPAGADGLFSTRQIAAAIYGSYEIERTRMMRAKASQEVRRDIKEDGKLLETEAVISVWASYLTHARQVIRHSELTEARKQEILFQLRSIPNAEYFETPATAEEI